jgi:hypothetical protein
MAQLRGNELVRQVFKRLCLQVLQIIFLVYSTKLWFQNIDIPELQTGSLLTYDDDTKRRLQGRSVG